MDVREGGDDGTGRGKRWPSKIESCLGPLSGRRCPIELDHSTRGIPGVRRNFPLRVLLLILFAETAMPNTEQISIHVPCYMILFNVGSIGQTMGEETREQ